MTRWRALALTLAILLAPLPAAGQAVNDLQFRPAASGTAPAILAVGADTNISINLIPKGTGTVNITGGALTPPVTLAAGTVVVSTPILTETQTWNAGAVTFIGNLKNITDTASADASTFWTFQVAGSNRLTLGKFGNITVTTPTLTTSNPPLNITSTMNAAGVTFQGIQYAATDTASAVGSRLLGLDVGGIQRFSVQKTAAGTWWGAIGGSANLSANGANIQGLTISSVAATDNTAFLEFNNPAGANGSAIATITGHTSGGATPNTRILFGNDAGVTNGGRIEFSTTNAGALAVRFGISKEGWLNYQAVGLAFASLGAPSNGVMVWCPDCTFANPCAGAGTGAWAKRIAGAWRCD